MQKKGMKKAVELLDSAVQRSQDVENSMPSSNTSPAPYKPKRRKHNTTDQAHSEKDNKSTADNPNTSTNETETNAVDTKKSEPQSKRQKKKEKMKLREGQLKENNRQEVKNKALNYLSMWKHSRSDWKFEKLKQIWLMDNLLDEKCIPDEMYPTVLEYFEGCKGMARETLLKKGMKVVKESEEKLEDNDEVIETVEYKRARLLLQALPTET